MKIQDLVEANYLDVGHHNGARMWIMFEPSNILTKITDPENEPNHYSSYTQQQMERSIARGRYDPTRNEVRIIVNHNYNYNIDSPIRGAALAKMLRKRLDRKFPGANQVLYGNYMAKSGTPLRNYFG